MTTKNTKSATKAEVEAEGTDTDEAAMVDFTVEIRGKEVNLTAPASFDDAPFEVMEAFENDRIATALKILLGPAGWNKLRAAGTRVSEFHHVVEAWNEATGLGE
ncbi:hypothetical protein OS125_11305 [Corynebacterium sp. P7003]|uniref:Tail assembly chaperone n=1 Tax=Corynebacterium pygosceleis TaxID=2800406 RepID=A0ABT3WXT2_9CORY|nr:hypothetical protein [Corynebacterium pygosceleis]MCX7445819.1 hypothetical protein [Corynebacterium pygosceleis]